MKIKAFFSVVSMLLILSTPLISCNEREGIGPYQTGSQTFNLNGFDRLQMGDAFGITVRQGNTFSVTATGDRRNLDDLDVRVSNGRLIAKYRSLRRNRQYETAFKITMPKLAAADFSGASRSTVSGFTGEDMSIDLSGASNMTISGSFERLKTDVSGASDLHAFDAIANTVDARASGASLLQATATTRLSATASGASDIRYRGNPTQLEMNSSGASSIRRE